MKNRILFHTCSAARSGQDLPLAPATAAHEWSPGTPYSKEIDGAALVKKRQTDEGLDVTREAKAIAYDIAGSDGILPCPISPYSTANRATTIFQERKKAPAASAGASLPET
jgi:hypothetical protein